MAQVRQDLTAAKAVSVLPRNFGEYLHSFPTKKGTDRMLIAGHFGQSQSTDNTFATADASKLLKEQSVRIGNPSEVVNALLRAKRIFVVTTGNFRVSDTGLEYLATLRTGGASEGNNP